MLFSHDLMPFSRWPLSENFRFYQNLSFVNEYSKQQHRIQLRQKKKKSKKALCILDLTRGKSLYTILS